MKKKLYRGIILLLFFVSACQNVSTTTETVPTESPIKGAEDEKTPLPTMESASGGQGGQFLQPSLNLDDLNNTSLEEDIIQEIAIFGGAGGGSPHCAGVKKKTPIIWGAPEQATELMQSVNFEICNLKPEEEVTMRVEKPVGETVEITKMAYSFPDGGPTVAEFEYLPMPDDPPGNYIFDISGNGWSLDYQHEVRAPETARLYEHELNLYFLGFAPNEPVKLLVYKGVDERGSYQSLMRLFGWAEYQMNANGQLKVELAQHLGDGTYVALGRDSGAANVSSPSYSIIRESYSIFCSGAPKLVGIHPGGRAEVLVDSIPAYDIEIPPGSSSYTFKKLADVAGRKGSVGNIVSNAYCVDGKYIWGITFGTSFEYHYLQEAGSDGPYLRPVGSASAIGAAESGIIPACPGTLPTRLQVGMNAEVTMSGAAPQLSLRSQPGMSAEQAHVIAAGRDLVILDGPVCAENSYWWYIRSEQSFEGWSREGDHEDYWIDPLP